MIYTHEVYDLVKVAIYTRVSTEDQAQDGYSLAAQRERLDAYCKAQGWSIYKIYEDEGFSGRNTKRPCYQAMLVDRDKWDMMLVMKMDRIHRNSRNFMEMMDALKSWGKEFSSMNESLDTSTAMGRFVVDIIQRIAQLESEQIGERVYVGMKQKAKESKGILGSRIPFGYYLENDIYIPRSKEAKIVHDIFMQYMNNKSLVEIARSLNQHGLTTRRGNTWSVWNIRYILHNPIYAGYLRWDGIINKWSNEPIVTPDIYNKVQLIFDSKRRKPKGKSILVQLPES